MMATETSPCPGGSEHVSSSLFTIYIPLHYRHTISGLFKHRSLLGEGGSRSLRAKQCNMDKEREAEIRRIMRNPSIAAE